MPCIVPTSASDARADPRTRRQGRQAERAREMSQRAAVRAHARYVPPPSRPRPAPRSHAVPVNGPVPPRVVAPGRARPATRATSRRLDARLAPLCALLLGLVGLVLGLCVVAHWIVPRAWSPAAFPLLVVGTLPILLRGQVNAQHYRSLRRRAGLGNRRGDHILALLYVLVFFTGVVGIAVLVSVGAAALIDLLVRWW